MRNHPYLEGSLFNIVKENRYTVVYALIHAAINRDVDKVKQLVEEIAQKQEFINDINQTNDQGETALHYALKLRSIPIAIILLQYGADLAICNNAGVAPFDYFYALSMSEQLSIFNQLHLSAQQHLLKICQYYYKSHPNLNHHVYFQLAGLHSLQALIVAHDHIMKIPNQEVDDDYLAPIQTTLPVYYFVNQDRVMLVGLLKHIEEYLRKLRQQSITPMSHAVGFAGLVRWFWQQEATVSPQAWRPLLDHINHDLIEKLKYLELLEDQLHAPGSYLPTSREMIRKLDGEILKLHHDQTVSEATLIFSNMRAIICMILGEMNRSNKSISMFLKVREQVQLR